MVDRTSSSWGLNGKPTLKVHGLFWIEGLEIDLPSLPALALAQALALGIRYRSIVV